MADLPGPDNPREEQAAPSHSGEPGPAPTEGAPYYDPRWYSRPQQAVYKQGQGTLILVLGILSLVVCGLLGPVAWVMGNNALRDIELGVSDPREQGYVVAGRVLGIISTSLMILFCCAYAGVFGFALMAGGLS